MILYVIMGVFGYLLFAAVLARLFIKYDIENWVFEGVRPGKREPKYDAGEIVWGMFIYPPALAIAIVVAAVYFLFFWPVIKVAEFIVK